MSRQQSPALVEQPAVMPHEEPVMLFALSLAEEGLTWSQDDLGPEDARHSRPMLHRDGLWLFDRGADDQSHRLLAYGLDGRRIGVIDLVALLGLTAPGEFLVAESSVDKDGTVWLLASRRFDATAMRMESFVLVGVSLQGKLISMRELPGFRYDGVALIEGETVLNLERGEGDAATWILYQAGERRALAGSTWGHQVIGVAGGVWEESLGSEVRFLRASDGAVMKTKAAGVAKPELLGVRGEGSFFGVERLVPYERLPEGQWLRQERTLETFFLDRRTWGAFSLGTSQLPANKVQGEEGRDFTLHFPRESRFDEQGNLYEIAWTPGHLRVFRSGLVPRVRERLPKP